MTMNASDIKIEQTLMPPNAHESSDERKRLHELQRLHELMAQTSDLPKLTGLDAEPITLPEDLFRLLQDVIAALAQGYPVRIDAKRTTLVSTSQAADILGVSRATMVRFLKEERLPYTQPGSHRRLELADVLEFKKTITHERHKAAGDVQRVTSVLFDESEQVSGE